MTTAEQRRHYRVDSQHLLNYTCHDEEGTLVKQGMGRTLNVSETGILLGTHVQLDAELKVELTIGMKDDLVELNGMIVYSKPGEKDNFESGIQFSDMDETGKEFLAEYIRVFRDQQ